MAPPLLPRTRLVVCPVCAEHVKRGEERCPHCGSALAETRSAAAAAAVLMGLALSGCPDKEGSTESMSVGEADYGTALVTSVGEADYGTAAFTTEGLTEGLPTTGTGTESMTGTSGTTSATETMGTTETTGTTGETVGETGSTETETTAGETGTTAATDATTTTTGAESDYGVAAL